MTQKIALFDLDYTLIPIDSDHAWNSFTATLGWHDPEDFNRRNDAFFEQYKAGTLDIFEYVHFATAGLRAQGAEKAHAAHAQFMEMVMQAAILPQALSLVQRHQAANDAVVIVTATNEFVTRPIADAFGVPELIAIELAREPGNGWFSGEIAGIPSFREGKVKRVEAWLAARGLSWESVESTFYSDSMNDLPLLEKVTHPVATNPEDRLRAIALERGWRILELF